MENNVKKAAAFSGERETRALLISKKVATASRTRAIKEDPIALKKEWPASGVIRITEGGQVGIAIGVGARVDRYFLAQFEV
jgi:hypothetical protein